MTCVGAAISKTERIEDSSYERSTDLWMYRGYNGFLYARSKLVQGTNAKFHTGDVVRCILDLDAGTLCFIVNGGTVQKTMFTDLAGFSISPAVSFYGPSRAVSIVNVERLDNTSSALSSSSQLDTLSKQINSRVVVALADINPTSTRTESQVPRMIRKDYKQYVRDSSLEKLFGRYELEKRVMVCDTTYSCLGTVMRSLDGKKIPFSSSICMMPVPFGRVYTRYKLPSNEFKYFKCRVGIEDSFQDASKEHRFEIRFYRDEELKTNWFAHHQQEGKSSQLCDISIPSHCTHVELVVTCKGDCPGAVIWFEPLLSNKRTTSKSTTPSQGIKDKTFDRILNPLVNLVRLYEKWNEPLNSEESDNTLLRGNGGIELPYAAFERFFFSWGQKKLSLLTHFPFHSNTGTVSNLREIVC